MTLTEAYVALGSGVAVWGFLVSRLRAKSWQTKGAVGAIHEGGDTLLAPGRIGLWTFLAVITSLFGLFIAAYHMRMMEGMKNGDWVHFPVPGVLWLNTTLLMAASVAIQSARAAADRAQRGQLRMRLFAAGMLTAAFLVGQLVAWRSLADTPFLTRANPAVAFFYLLTAVHGLHLLGGLVVWARTLRRLAGSGLGPEQAQLVVGLCAVYWHYLLAVWLVLFGLMLST